jgi:hypothetical protein
MERSRSSIRSRGTLSLLTGSCNRNVCTNLRQFK